MPAAPPRPFLDGREPKAEIRARQVLKMFTATTVYRIEGEQLTQLADTQELARFKVIR
jgi:hypothetical protein